MKEKRRTKRSVIRTAVILFLICLALPLSVSAADNGLPDGYEPDIYNAIPAQQFKNVFETGTITVSGIDVTADSYVSIFDPDDTIHFRIFNSTTQETEYEVDTVNNLDGTHTLPDLELKKNHNYIFFVEDTEYVRGSSIYVQALDDGAAMATEGAGAYDYKYVVKDSEGKEQYNLRYAKLKKINVFRRSSAVEEPREEARCCIGCTDMPVVVKYKGQPVTEQLSFRFVSDIETLQGITNYKSETAGQGILYANLLEDVTYMVYLESDGYVMDPFPIVVKDKSEYKEGRYAYNHTTCVRVDAEHPISLYDSEEEMYDDPAQGDVRLSVTSLKGNVTVAGMNFRHLLILDREMDKSLASSLEGKTCEVTGITAVNPHRWEISKIMGTPFSITKKIDGGKLVTHVYYIMDGKLNEIGFKQTSGKEVSFSMDSLSLYPVVIEYDANKTYDQKQAEGRAAREAKERKAKEAAKEAAWKGKIDKKLPSPKIATPAAAKKAVTVKWKKLTKKQLSKAGKIKIEVQYSLDKKFPMEKTKSKYASKAKKSLKIKSLKSKKKYYVRVRTVKTVKGIKHVSKWSKVKKVKIR